MMGKIKVSVSQAGGTDDDLILGSGILTLTLTTSDGSALPGSITINSLSVTGLSAFTSQTTPATSPGSSTSLQYGSVNTAGVIGNNFSITHSVTTMDWDNTSGKVANSSSALVEEVKGTGQVSKPQSSSMSFWQKIMQFIRRLFGHKT